MKRLNIERVRPSYLQVADQLRSIIMNGDLESGERLPPESELIQTFGVGRSTLREALRVLSAEKLVETRRGVNGGTFIVDPVPEQIEDTLETALGLLANCDGLSVNELLEAREVLEVLAARRAAIHRTEEHVTELLTLADHPPSGPAFEEHRSFHTVILEASGNRLLQIMAVPVYGVIRKRFQRDDADPEFWERVRDEHIRIAKHIEMGEQEAAAEEMRRHLRRLGETYEKIDREGRNDWARD